MKNLALPRFYERERWPYVQDQHAIDKLAYWVRQIPWKFFCTFTFAWEDVSDEWADRVFAEFINRLEDTLGCEVCFVRGDEKRVSGCGKPASGRHFHVLLTCLAPVDSALIESMWENMAGKRAEGAGALVKEYQSSGNGARYVLKCMNQPDGNWDFRNLELFHPDSKKSQKMNKRWRRRLKRFEARHMKFAAQSA